MFLAVCDAGEWIPLIYVNIIDGSSTFACASTFQEVLDLMESYEHANAFSYIYQFIPGELGYANRWRRILFDTAISNPDAWQLW